MTLNGYLEYFDRLIRSAERLFKLVPADKIDWKPTEDSFTTGQLMAHMASSLASYGRGIGTGKWGVGSLQEIMEHNRQTPSLGAAEALQALNSSYSEFRRLVGGLAEEEFSSGEIDSPQFGRVPRWRAALLAMEHHLNHKAELFMYLKLVGVKVDTRHLYAR